MMRFLAGENWGRRLAAFLLLTGGALLATGCAIKPETHLASRCNFKTYSVETFTPTNLDDMASGTSGGSEAMSASLIGQDEADEMMPVGSAMMNALTAPSTKRLEGRYDRSVLFLSGGSLHGAFGAGYLAQWKRNRGSLPRFRVVTGISTGSILGSFAFANMPEIAESAYAIRNESELLDRLVGFRKGNPTLPGYVGIVRNGAIGDLAPLRSYLDGKLNDQVMDAVATGYHDGRLFYVGVVDVDTGLALALDMTDMAARWQDARLHGRTADRAHAKACYVEAIIASSSAPMAALPVFIDNRMYVDGGMRFGAFSDEVGKLLPPMSNGLMSKKEVLKDLAIHLIVNGYQTTPNKCGRADPAKCDPPRDERGKDPIRSSAPHKKWKFLDLALRSESILANQVYRFSAENIFLKAKLAETKFTYAQIGEEALNHPWKGDEMFPGETTCSAAKVADEAEQDPVQFYPRYMHCIIDYGRLRGGQDFPAGG